MEESGDVGPDDQRFMMLQVGGSNQGELSRLVVVQNFFKDLEERIGR